MRHTLYTVAINNNRQHHRIIHHPALSPSSTCAYIIISTIILINRLIYHNQHIMTFTIRMHLSSADIIYADGRCSCHITAIREGFPLQLPAATAAKSLQCVMAFCRPTQLPVHCSTQRRAFRHRQRQQQPMTMTVIVTTTMTMTMTKMITNNHDDDDEDDDDDDDYASN